MMSNADDLSNINCSSLTNSDLVSRYLAATPSYLYNVSPRQHNFYFSEMLRSFVQTKSDSALLHTTSIRQRKRPWKESQDRSIEPKIREKYKTDYIETQNLEYNHEFQGHYVQQPQSLFRNHPLLQENEFTKSLTEDNHEANSHITNSITQAIDKIVIQKMNPSKSVFDSNYKVNTEQSKTCMKDKKILYLPKEGSFFPQVKKAITVDTSNAKNRATYLENNFFKYHGKLPCDNLFSLQLKNSFDVAQKNYFSNHSVRSNEVANIEDFSMKNKTTSDIMHNPLWYSQYSSTQNYPAIDPLHLFIDLRVSGHIWDRQYNQKHIFSRNKHHSAFSVPQPKQYNVPLNLTRGESMDTSFGEENMKGTHYILKNIQYTYKKIANSENLPTNNI